MRILRIPKQKKGILAWSVSIGFVSFALFLLVGFLLTNEPEDTTPFVVSVDPLNKEILGIEVALNSDGDIPESNPLRSLADTLQIENLYAAVISSLGTIGNFASPSVKYIRVQEGMRKEEVAGILQKQLGWNDTQKETFITGHTKGSTPATNNFEGYLYPGTYFVSKTEDINTLRKMMLDRFNQEVLSRYATSTRSIVNIDTALSIASIIQREAGGKSDMRIISGVIWNRIFRGMNLQMDATLQYAKGNEDIGWWPRVVPDDKYIDSPYNTYQLAGLPPTPIANPSIAAIEAALNPLKTSCLFYIHDSRRKIHCAKTYTQHKANIKKYYPRSS